MKLIVIAGFLGSGKTSLLLALARDLVRRRHTVAVIENEIGEVGIDGRIVADEGLVVRELFGGCVCCSLSIGVVDTLDALARTVAPDYVLLEPTGIAQPAELATTISQYASSVEDVRILTLVDAERFELLVEVMGPLLEAQVVHADVVAVTKADLVPADQLGQVLAGVQALAPGKPAVAVAVPQADGLRSLFAELL
jgi:G3E family GTPase